MVMLVGDPERIEGCPRQDEEWQCVARKRPEPSQGVEQARAPDADGQCEAEHSQEREHGSEDQGHRSAEGEVPSPADQSRPGRLIIPYFFPQSYHPTLLPYLRYHHCDILYVAFSLIGRLISSRCALFYCNLQQQEASEARKSLKLSQKEIISTNEKKHKVKLGISALKNKMLKVL